MMMNLLMEDRNIYSVHGDYHYMEMMQTSKTNQGNVKGSHCDFDLMSDAIGVEAAALILAISLAEEMNLTKVVLLSDYLQLVQFSNGDDIKLAWRSSDLFEHCRSLISSYLFFKIMYIKRVNNLLAD
ncbi:uncharacterized protein LOC113293732 isoform X1 [Papaver somniferum]|uniref:uncharacterized protein LOC113293732 isoform X1 n=1 Tax=Papaver somniferum TaxID=3469 RepID=UPI000E70229A|nr:uncharacterized protein LOC113293732 isoform X1 [Papaver somniferum]